MKDLNKSIEFFSALGFEFDRRFTDENATCMVLGADSYAMLLFEPFFQQFTGKKLVDAAADSTEAIVTILLDSRQQVDELVDKALATVRARSTTLTRKRACTGAVSPTWTGTSGKPSTWTWQPWRAEQRMIAQGPTSAGRSNRPSRCLPRELLAR